MENMISDDSPLAQLLEGGLPPSTMTMPCAVGTNRRPGQGTAPSPYDDHDHDHDTETSTSTNFPQSFAPRGPSTLQSRIRDRLPQPLRIHARHGSIARIHTACSVRVRLGCLVHAR